MGYELDGTVTLHVPMKILDIKGKKVLVKADDHVVWLKKGEQVIITGTITIHPQKMRRDLAIVEVPKP